MTMEPQPQPAPSRGRLERTARSIRSGLRRYPAQIVRSLLSRDLAKEGGAVRLLHELAPHDLALSWLGHASVVCQFGELQVAVDPVLSSRIGPRIAGRTIGLGRVSQAPINAPSLRGVPLVLLTHAHFDHLDKPTLKQMASPDTTVVVPVGCSRLVPRGFADVVELRAGKAFELRELRVDAIQPRHWGARTAVDRARGVNSYLVRSDAGSVLFTGDSASTDAFDSVEDVDVAVFGIGAYEPWEHMHATPEQVWSMFQRTGARYLLPVHHSTFELSDEPLDEPMHRLTAAAGDIDGAILAAAPGDVMVVRTRND